VNNNWGGSPPVEPQPSSPPGGPTPPAGGWEIPREQAAAAADLLTQLNELLAELVPEDLQKRIAEAVRELLVALRALIDWLVERLERRPGGPVEVRDIPIL
jgi:hypothetical protein